MKRILTSALAILFITLCFVHTAEARDPAVPFPWGRAQEDAFPWDRVDGDWILESSDSSPVVIKIESREDLIGRHHLIVTQVDRESGRVLARGFKSQTDLMQTRVPVALFDRQGRKRVITFISYRADTGETALVAKLDGFRSLVSTYVLKRVEF